MFPYWGGQMRKQRKKRFISRQRKRIRRIQGTGENPETLLLCPELRREEPGGFTLRRGGEGRGGFSAAPPRALGAVEATTSPARGAETLLAETPRRKPHRVSVTRSFMES